MLEVNRKREFNKEQMKKELKNMEKSYHISFKSKVHEQQKQAQRELRRSCENGHRMLSRNQARLKEYANKIRQENNKSPRNLQQSLDCKFPTDNSKTNMKWFYGRFGEKEWQ